MASHLDTCSFCSGAIDANCGTWGARDAICHSCTNRAAEQIVHDRTTEPSLAARCNFCYVRTSTDSALVASDDHYICVECIILIKRELLSAPIQEMSPTKGVLRLARNAPPNTSLERTRGR
jgi:hypothetical protein